MFSLKKEVSNSRKKTSALLTCIETHLNAVILFKKMMFAKLTVLMLIFRAVQCIEPEVCSNGDDVFRGIAQDRFVISNSKTVRLDAIKLSSVCDHGVNCREFCLFDSLEWIFFEVKKVCPYHT